MEHRYWIYMMGGAHGRALYIGMTNDIVRRVQEHKTGEIIGFTSKYNCCHLLYLEGYNDIRDTIAREKQLKGWTRARKEELIATLNPRRLDLAAEWEMPSEWNRFFADAQNDKVVL